jgi:hypothetical protein
MIVLILYDTRHENTTRVPSILQPTLIMQAGAVVAVLSLLLPLLLLPFVSFSSSQQNQFKKIKNYIIMNIKIYIFILFVCIFFSRADELLGNILVTCSFTPNIPAAL